MEAVEGPEGLAPQLVAIDGIGDQAEVGKEGVDGVPVGDGRRGGGVVVVVVATFQRTFLSTPRSTGRSEVSRTPDPPGPRNRGQSSAPAGQIRAAKSSEAVAPNGFTLDLPTCRQSACYARSPFTTWAGSSTPTSF